MKVLAIMGDYRDGQTRRAVEEFEQHLKAYIDLEFNYLYLKDINLQLCRGCAVCLEKGEEFCPLKDDRDSILAKMNEADGIIFATPNYALQVTSLMKNFLDRLAFVFHRPCFFHKTFTSIVTQGVYGGNDIIKYLDKVAEFWGFITIKGAVLTVPWGAYKPKKEWPKEEHAKISNQLNRLAQEFHKKLLSEKSPKPKLSRVILFRFVRSFHKHSVEKEKDYTYFRDKGWLESDFYYKVNLSFTQKILGGFIDWVQKRKVNKNN